jgi:hypothetical protein
MDAVPLVLQLKTHLVKLSLTHQLHHLLQMKPSTEISMLR